MKRTLSLAGGLALLAAVGLPAASASAQTTSPVPPPAPNPPSVVEICAATSLAAVDSLLDRVADQGLTGPLAPLADITVPKDSDSVKLDVGSDLPTVRDLLDCDPEVTPTTVPPTTTPAPTTTMTAPPTTTLTVPPKEDDEDEDDDTGVIRIPTGGVQTGYGPTS